MTCHEFNILVDDFIDGRLPAAHKDTFHAHLTSCYICQDLLRKMQEFKKRIDNLPLSYEPPKGMLERITSDIESAAGGGGQSAGSKPAGDAESGPKSFIPGSGSRRRNGRSNTSEADMYRSSTGKNKISPAYLWGAILLLLILLAAWYFLLR